MFSNNVSAEIQYLVPVTINQEAYEPVGENAVEMGNTIRDLQNLTKEKIMKELGLCVSLVLFSKFCVTEGICGEVVPRRISEFNGIKGD